MAAKHYQCAQNGTGEGLTDISTKFAVGHFAEAGDRALETLSSLLIFYVCPPSGLQQ